MAPKDSLYFREWNRMTRTKTTAHKSTGKRPRESLVSNLPRKTLSSEQARKNVAKAMAAAQKNLGNPPRTGGLKKPVVQAWDRGPERNPALPENRGASHQEITLQ